MQTDTYSMGDFVCTAYYYLGLYILLSVDMTTDHIYVKYRYYNILSFQ